MRKPVSIFFALLILGISMQLGITTHHCAGKLSQTRFIYGYGTTGCGMNCQLPSNETEHQDTRFNKLSCCEDFIFTISVDEYQPATQKIYIETPLFPIQRKNHILTSYHLIVNTNASNIPHPLTTEVFLPLIQVFII
jgi:hypothetical protein